MIEAIKGKLQSAVSSALSTAKSVAASVSSAAKEAAMMREANELNRKAVEDQWKFNSAEAQKNRDFQREMSNSAYQRAVADMRAAGLNPLLAYSQGGASTPGGSTAFGTAQQVAHNQTLDLISALGDAFSQLTSAQKGESQVIVGDEIEQKLASGAAKVETVAAKIAEVVDEKVQEASGFSVSEAIELTLQTLGIKKENEHRMTAEELIEAEKLLPEVFKKSEAISKAKKNTDAQKVIAEAKATFEDPEKLEKWIRAQRWTSDELQKVIKDAYSPDNDEIPKNLKIGP